MEHKTSVLAEEGRQDLRITREFNLPVALLFRAFEEPDLVSQWMGTKVIKLESRKHGSYQFETTDPKGNKFTFHGVIHEFIPGRKILRTFEFESMPFGVQLESLEFEGISDQTSRLTMHVVYQTTSQRDQQLKLPFAFGINMAHNRLQEIMGK